MTDKQEILEDALSKRLAKLGAMPVDLSRLEARLRQEVTAPAAAPAQRTKIWWWKPALSIAAALIIVATVAWAVFVPSNAEASPADFARLHTEMVQGDHVMHVSTIDEANKMIEAMAKGQVSIPTIPDAHLHACCMREIKNKKVACVLLENEGEPVTMTVAAAGDVKCSGTATSCVAGIDYHVHRVGDLNMVMTERNDRLVCLISKSTPEQLMALASKLQF
jgi:hypothetical protein